MELAIHVGSIVVVRRVNPEDVGVGDIIAFKTGDSKMIHRVIDKVYEGNSFYFRTKGDANEDPDPWSVKPQDGNWSFTLSNSILRLLIMVRSNTLRRHTLYSCPCNNPYSWRG